MHTLPDTLEQATAGAIAATFMALNAGQSRLIIELRFSELNPLPLGYEFAVKFQAVYGDRWQALFADAGTAALAKRDWTDLEFSARGVNEGRAAIRPQDQAFLLVAPSSIEVDRVEKLLELAGDRPFVMVNPRLENSEVGLGLAARRLRERFLSRFELCYYLQPLDQGALFRAYPQAWQVWQQTDTSMSLLQELADRPSQEDLDRLFRQTTGRSSSWLTQLQQFLNALSR
ncbi:MAG: DUF1995 family protein [Pseudanabaenaceae cyanobacterium bins.68]|nr:DUF1995 family protein [Pseudanabaenaceae cyanobacterium bins.68]